MDTKKELITNTVSHLLKFARKFTFMETMPIKIDKDREITTNEAHIIQAIGENEEINITSLSKLFGVTKSATSQMISKLSKNGYVKKTAGSIL
jgi:DNA-binding MarR family transcriptional regulator